VDKQEQDRCFGSQHKLFLGLVIAQQSSLYAYILSLVFHPADAEDILQDTLALMWERFDEFEPGTRFTAWGKAIARNKIMTYLRENKSSRLQFNAELLNTIESESCQLDNLSDRLSKLNHCVAQLSEKEKSLLKLRYELDLPFQKIAMRFGISKQSAYRFVSRIHAKLVKCLNLALTQGGVL